MAYKQIGSVIQFDGENETPKIQLDSSALKEFIVFLQDFGRSNLDGLSVDQIRTKTKNKEIGRLNLYYFNPNDNAPKFVKKNVCIKIS